MNWDTAVATWHQGRIDTGAVDKYGNKLFQYDRVIHQEEGEILGFMILWNPLTNEFVASHEEGFWMPFENLHLTEKVASREQ